MTEKKIKVDNLNIYKINNTLDYYKYIASNEKKDDDLLIYGEDYNKFSMCKYIDVIRFFINNYHLWGKQYSDDEISRLGKCFAQLLFKKDVSDKELLKEFFEAFLKFSPSSLPTVPLFRFYYSEKYKSDIKNHLYNMGSERNKIINDLEVLELKKKKGDALEHLVKCFNSCYCEVDITGVAIWNMSNFPNNKIEDIKKLWNEFKKNIKEMDSWWLFYMYR